MELDADHLHLEAKYGGFLGKPRLLDSVPPDEIEQLRVTSLYRALLNYANWSTISFPKDLGMAGGTPATQMLLRKALKLNDDGDVRLPQ